MNTNETLMSGILRTCSTMSQRVRILHGNMIVDAVIRGDGQQFSIMYDPEAETAVQFTFNLVSVSEITVVPGTDGLPLVTVRVKT